MLGVAAGLYGDLFPFLLMLGCICALAALVPRALRVIAIASALGLIVGVLAARFNADPVVEPLVPPYPTEIAGTINSDPRLTSFGLVVDLHWEDRDGIRRHSALFLPSSVEVGRGDRVRVVPGFGGPAFEPIFASGLEVTSSSGSLEMRRRDARLSSTNRILDRTPGSPGSLALGLLIGDDSGLTASERQNLRSSGLSHITAVSGSNVAMAIGVVAFLFRALVGRQWTWVVLQLIAIVVYVWIVGAEPPIIRAAIMGALALIALRLGRPSHLVTLLLLSGAVMAALDPEVLASLSFQLSFQAMLALGVAGQRILRLDGRLKQVVAILAAPVAAAIATAPLIALRFGFFGLGTVPANVLVAPVIAPATALSALTALLGDVPVVGLVAGTLLWGLTSFILGVARLIGGINGAYWTFAPPGVGVTVLCYLLIAACVAPLVPEARLALHRLKVWSAAQPAAAFSSAFASLALLWMLATFSN
jgi:ComEC/Rec2-related protein